MLVQKGVGQASLGSDEGRYVRMGEFGGDVKGSRELGRIGNLDGWKWQNWSLEQRRDSIGG